MQDFIEITLIVIIIYTILYHSYYGFGHETKAPAPRHATHKGYYPALIEISLWGKNGHIVEIEIAKPFDAYRIYMAWNKSLERNESIVFLDAHTQRQIVPVRTSSSVLSIQWVECTNPPETPQTTHA